MYICVCTNYKVTFIYLLNFVTRGNLNILVDVISIATFIVKTTNFYNAVSQQHTNNNVLVDLIIMFHVKHIIWNNELSTFKAKCFVRINSLFQIICLGLLVHYYLCVAFIVEVSRFYNKSCDGYYVYQSIQIPSCYEIK